ncbi:hypothetical protein R1sor_022815 [Riccia sorocarpa]|uniref:Reverse transcriptase zinc-binding domain-containing protein n=1 Tax=Riccia sorocarpa TaxID=122646 RepID=A0ABD3GN44_9MARC
MQDPVICCFSRNTRNKAYEWGLADGICARCGLEKETYTHAVWHCPRLREQTTWITWLFFSEEQRTTSTQGHEQLLTVMDQALKNHGRHQAHILLLLAALRINWDERNEATFKGKNNFRGITVTINEARNEVKALQADAPITQKHDETLQKTEQMIQFWENETRRWFAGETTRTRQPPFRITARPDSTPHRQQSQETEQHWDIDNLIEQDHRETSHGNESGRNDSDARGRRIRSPNQDPTSPLDTE